MIWIAPEKRVHVALLVSEGNVVVGSGCELSKFVRRRESVWSSKLKVPDERVQDGFVRPVESVGMTAGNFRPCVAL